MKKLISVRTIILTGSLLLQLSALCFHAHGAAGDVDLSFDPGSGVNGAVKAVALQPDGKLVIAGEFTMVRGLLRQSIARLNTDGGGDVTFNAGMNVDSRYISSITMQADGRLIVTSDYFATPDAKKVVRLNGDGTLDTAFAVKAGTFPPDSGVTCAAVQPDGKVILGGYYYDFYVDDDGSIHYYRASLLIRLNANGTTDNSFTNGNGTFGGALSVVTLQPDGRILIAGDIVTKVNGTNHYSLARLNANGTVNTNFNPGVDGFILSLGLQPDGKILVAGNYIGYGTNRNQIARLNADGSRDGSFVSGIDGGSSLGSIAIQPDGKAICSGGAYIFVNGVSRGNLVRFNSNGSVDANFNATTGAPNNSGAAIALQSDGKILLGGRFTLINGTNREHVARLNADGTLDVSFNPGSSISASVNSLALQADGKVIIGGNFERAGGMQRGRVARLNANGNLDSGFDPGTGIGGATFTSFLHVSAVLSQPDGKVLVGGDFTSFNGVARTQLARLNADGSVDMSFVPGIGRPANLYSLYVAALAVQPDGKILVGGDPNIGNGTNANGIARLNADGSRDTSFHPDTIGTTGGEYTESKALAVQPDGKILVGGSWIRVLISDPDPQFLLTRLNPDGSRDTNFLTVAGSGQVVNSIALQPDGKILFGSASVYGDLPGWVGRLNTNGSVDNTFNVVSANRPVNSLALQFDGRIVIGGLFSTLNGTNRNDIARLNADGSVDSSFNPGAAARVNSIALQPDGKVLIGGDSLTFNGVLRPCVARLYGDSVAPSLNIVRSNTFVIVSWPVTGLNFQLQESTNFSFQNSWSPVAQPAVTNTGQISGTVPASAARRFFRLKLE